MSNTQNVVNNWLMSHGFTVGVQDMIAKKSTNNNIKAALESFKRKVQRIT